MDAAKAAAVMRRAALRVMEAAEKAPMIGAAAAAPIQAAFIAKEVPSMRLSGVNRPRGARVAVKAYPVREGAVVAAVGPLHLVERDTAAHVVSPRRRKALFARGWTGPRQRVLHPGTSGSHPFERGYPSAVRVAVRAVEEHMRKAVK